MSIADERLVIRDRRTMPLPDIVAAESVPVARPATRAGLVSGRWGWLPLLSLVSASGLLLVAVADTAARNVQPWAEPLFWAALLVIYVPMLLRVAMADVPRREVVGLVVALGISLYLVKVLHSPVAFTLHDEFYHWRSTADIVNSAHLMSFNPMLPISSLYPGLSTVTAALVSTGGLSYFDAGTLVIMVVRLVLVLSLLLAYSQLSGSLRIGGLATVIYMANPNYLFFDAQFSYETLALPLAVFAIFIVLFRHQTTGWQRVAVTWVSLLALLAVVASHHITSYILLAFLGLWTVIDLIRRRTAQDEPRPWPFALFALVPTALWLWLIAPQTLNYLLPHLGAAVNELSRMLTSSGAGDSGRQLFQSKSGTVSPLWERVTALSTVGLIMLGLLFGIPQIWKRFSHKPAVLALGAVALAYPGSLAFRLTGSGWEASNRSSEFLFIALGFVLAVVVVEVGLARRGDWIGTVGLAVCAGIVFCGGVIAGWPPPWRLPGPYYVDVKLAGERSIQSEGVAAAEWAYLYLGPDNVVAADDTNMLLMGSYGEQHITTTLSGGINSAWVLYSMRVNEDQLKLLRTGHVAYIVVDRRLRMAPQIASNFYPDSDINVALAKFDLMANVSRVYDGGDITIYDVRALSNATP